MHFTPALFSSSCNQDVVKFQKLVAHPGQWERSGLDQIQVAQIKFQNPIIAI